MFTKITQVVTYVHLALNCKRGATAIEYGLIAGAMAVVIIAAMAILTPDIKTLFTGIGTALTTNTP
jgi:pilus assembly protein Flp/PilA